MRRIPRVARRFIGVTFALALCAGLAGLSAAGGEPLGRRPFADSRDPPAYLELDVAARARNELGHAVFNTHWVPSGTAGAARRAGLGPLFNSQACDSCHNEGARGRGPFGDGADSGSLVIQLETPDEEGAPTPDYNSGYGHILNLSAVDGLAARRWCRFITRSAPGTTPMARRGRCAHRRIQSPRCATVPCRRTRS